MAYLAPHYKQSTVICKNCKSKFNVFPYRKNIAKYCSTKCRQIHFMKNTDYRKKTLEVLPHKKGAEHPQWKGEKIKYVALHIWLRNNFKKSGVCEFCKEGGKKTAWANKTGEYKRDITDFIELCYKCHWHYDRENNFKHRYENETKNITT